MELFGIFLWAAFCFWLVRLGVTGREIFLFSTWIILALSFVGALVRLLIS
jgi:hypothetical protein